ncbi:hypothetical protein [Humisphaera borealis]|uniref:Uncharacterized protein n=1 Tax=Humisphaera borealis TaxID=2807512 RepID=A0A7M2WU70_9BACT|nr:hypothetical protein [Humisphaera borealis]QOV88712.1 hypothetical protein IPV69_21145 [Humisphaera borealis]
MITFPCNNCREELSVPSDLAGGEIQCPTCGWLASVPLLSDLPNLRPDGTHAVQPVVEREEADRLAGLVRSFGRRRVDDAGEEIDNRTLPEAIDLAPIAPPPSRPAPRYDPETGERLDPLEIRREAPIPAVPLGPLGRSGPPTVGYATPGKTSFAPRTSVWMELFTPGNAFVMVVIWFAHLCATIVDFFVRYFLAVLQKAGGIDIPAWPFNLLFWLVLAHYANTIFDTGEEQRDDLPRPLRNGSFSEDVFAPLLRAIVAYTLAYLPMTLLLRLADSDESRRILLSGGLMFGGLVFPALLLCACGSNTLANLRPDRVLRVIRVCGWAYWRLALITVPLVPLYLWTALGVNYIDPLIGGSKIGNFTAGLLARGLIAMPLLCICVYLAHGVCWRLGRLQRVHHTEFNWAWELHEEERQAERRRRQREREEAARTRNANAV